MAPSNKITSFQNEIFKKYLNLSRTPKNSELFLVEGEREVRRALEMKLELESILTTESSTWKNYPVVEFAAPLLAKLLVRESKNAVVGVFKKPLSKDFREFLDKKLTTKIIALENCEKPGNLGAVLRTAVAFGMTGIVLLGKSADPWSANSVRASVGAVFEIPIFCLEYADFFQTCKEHKIRTFAAYLNEKSESLFKIDLPKKLAFIFGAEDTGLSEKVTSQVDKLVMFPMSGAKTVDSLNLAVSAAVFTAELLRRDLEIIRQLDLQTNT